MEEEEEEEWWGQNVLHHIDLRARSFAPMVESTPANSGRSCLRAMRRIKSEMIPEDVRTCAGHEPRIARISPRPNRHWTVFMAHAVRDDVPRE